MPGRSTRGISAGRASTGVSMLGGSIQEYDAGRVIPNRDCLFLELKLIIYELLFSNCISMRA